MSNQVTNETITYIEGNTLYEEKVNENNEESDINLENSRANIITGNDSFYLDNIDIDEIDGILSLKQLEYSGNVTTNGKSLKSSNKYNSTSVTYKIRDTISLTKQVQSEYPVMHIKVEKRCSLESITPRIEKFKNIDKFGILIFQDENMEKVLDNTLSTSKTLYYNDMNIVYNSNLDVSLAKVNVSKDGIKYLDTLHTFKPNIQLDPGVYSIMCYATVEKGYSEGIIYMDLFNTYNQNKTYGVATKCIGHGFSEHSVPSVLYLEPENVTTSSWDIVFEYENAQYAKQGVITSQNFESDLPIYACSMSSIYKIPEGCSLKIYVSNNGGRTYADITNQTVTFSGTGNSFRWKAVFVGTGEATPTIFYNNGKNYALMFNLGQKNNNSDVTIYDNYFKSKILDGNYITQLVTGDGNAINRFSEWEFARTWMTEHDGHTIIDVCTSFDDKISFYPNFTEEQYKELNGDILMWTTIFANLTLDDFTNNSVDYSDYNRDVEEDEHNYYFDLDEDNTYVDDDGIVICSGSDNGLGNINSDDINMELFQYGTTMDGFRYAAFTPYAGLSKISDTYYCSESIGEYYNPNAIILGKSFANGINVDTNYNAITIDIIPQLSDNDRTLPANLLELVISTTTNGLVVDKNTNTEYGQVYPIMQELKNNQHNIITISNMKNIFKTKDIHSIGIRVKDAQGYINEGEDEPTYNTLKGSIDNINDSDKISIGYIKLVNYSVCNLNGTSNIERIQWRPIDENTSCTCDIGVLKYENKVATDIEWIPIFPNSPIILSQDKTSIQLASGSYTGDNATKIVEQINNDSLNMIKFKIPKNSTTGPIASFDTNIELDSYDYIKIVFYSPDVILKGDIYIDFYDTDDIQNNEPFESFPLPEWIINETITASTYNKQWMEFWNQSILPLLNFRIPTSPSTTAVNTNVCNVFYKRRSTDKTLLKKIVLRKNRATIGDGQRDNINLDLGLIQAIKGNTLPALGPKMQMRFYPTTNGIEAPEIRKYGVVFKLQ